MTDLVAQRGLITSPVATPSTEIAREEEFQALLATEGQPGIGGGISSSIRVGVQEEEDAEAGAIVAIGEAGGRGRRSTETREG
jgi:hypothetical protein